MQLLGFSDLATGALAVCASIGAAMGFLLGGGVGDFLAMKYPNIARPAVNQISLLFAGPLYVIFLKALPGERACCKQTTLLENRQTNHTNPLGLQLCKRRCSRVATRQSL